MAIKLNKEESLFRREIVFAADSQTVNIENTMINLFMLLKHNGQRPRQRARKSGDIEVETIKNVFNVLEEKGDVSGFKEFSNAAELWIRSNLTNMVNRGSVDKEKVSALRPIHLESYRVRNAANTKDRNSADQVYLMLGAKPTVKEDLKSFLMEGWDPTTDKIINNDSLDVDSLGVLHVIKNIKPGFLDSDASLNQIKPLLLEDAELFCDDVRRLLVYKREIPRSVMIDYLKTITAFHLSRYAQKLILVLPKMIKAGTTKVNYDWNVVLDATDDFDSRSAKIAAADCEVLYNSIQDYIRANYEIGAVLSAFDLSRNASASLETACQLLKNRGEDFINLFKARWSLKKGDLADPQDIELVNEIVKYEDGEFEKYIELILSIRSKYLYKKHVELIDTLSLKNNERGFLAQGRSRKHPRRFVLGTRLLETLVQILVLESKDNSFATRSLSIEELIQNLRERYGLVINGLIEPRFSDADLQTHLAFKENIDAFKMKLRQIGFYNDLSDAYILQRIRPRYQLNVQ
jgi:hypothetical protein